MVLLRVPELQPSGGRLGRLGEGGGGDSGLSVLLRRDSNIGTSLSLAFTHFPGLQPEHKALPTFTFQQGSIENGHQGLV